MKSHHRGRLFETMIVKNHSILATSGVMTGLVRARLRQKPERRGRSTRSRASAPESAADPDLAARATGGERIAGFAEALLDPIEDFEDAEALVVRRLPAAGGPEVEAAGGPASGLDDAFDAADDDGFLPAGEEAAVRIVSRRSQPSVWPVAEADNVADPGADSGADPGHPGDLDSDLGGEEPPSTPSVSEDGPRERLGYSPEFIARRMQVRDDEDGGADYAGYRDEVEEASVTIIRARGQEEPASGVVPEHIANDQADPAAVPDSAGEKPKKRAFGSRFLRALTGE